MNTPRQAAHTDPLPDSRPGSRNIPQTGRSKAPIPPKRSLFILCIDDDAVMLEVTRDCLSHYEHRVRVAPSGKFGVEVFHSAILKCEPYDAVITDLRMPDMDGYEVARMIKAESPHTPVIMMTGEDNLAVEDNTMAPAVDIVVGKPPRMRELNDLLLRITLYHTN